MNFLFNFNITTIVLNCKYIIGISNMKYIILNWSTTPVFTNHKCKKKNANTTNATHGHINANVPGDFSFQSI